MIKNIIITMHYIVKYTLIIVCLYMIFITNQVMVNEVILFLKNQPTNYIIHEIIYTIYLSAMIDFMLQINNIRPIMLFV